jgi:prolyl-tRNA synthetase
MKDLSSTLKTMMDTMQKDLLTAATKHLEEHKKKVTKWEEFTKALDSRCIALAPWCEDAKCEGNIKKRSGEEAKEEDTASTEENTSGEVLQKLTGAAKSLNIPFDQPGSSPLLFFLLFFSSSRSLVSVFICF